MKKSKLLQNSKDLLSRSFNPAKCKTSLRLAGSRLKLLRNKKDVQVKQMKREIAQLLETGQDQTARIRVEHVIREEKMMAAYDLLEIYCELVVARLPVIESQKNCPIDLKEAIASLVFAAPRCGDVPELLDVRKQFTTKYGKDFTTAATELRPQCGVGRMMVEKLSAAAPDVQTKTNILSAIAEEHNVKWKPTSFGEKDPAPHSDRLSGPSSFKKENEQFPEPPRFEAVQVQPLSPSIFSQPDDKTSIFVETSSFKTPSQFGARPPALGDERAQEDYRTNPLDRSSWHMGFKDATSAAHAAAESAERASMAARAAAELSIHGPISSQYSTNSDVDILKYEGPKVHHSKTEFSDASIDNRSSSERTRLQNEQRIVTQLKDHDSGGLHRFSQSASLKSNVSTDDDSPDHGIPIVDEYSQKSSIIEDVSAKIGPEEAYNVDEKKDGKQRVVIPSSSRSSVSDHVNIFSNYENDALFRDNYDSDIDDRGFDKGPTYDEHTYDDEQGLDFYSSSSGRKSPEHMSADADSWSRRASSSKIVNPTASLYFTRENSSHDLSENTALTNDSELDSAPLTFDESDGSISEIDDDMNTKHGTVDDSRDLRKVETGQSVESTFKHEKNSVFDSTDLSLSSDDELGSSMEMLRKINQVNRFDESDEIDDEPIVESGERLNFGKLTGGFRHKGHNHLPFVKNRSDVSSSEKKEPEITATFEKPTTVERPRIGTTTPDHKKNSRTRDVRSDSDSDSYGRKQTVKEVEAKSSSFLGSSDNSDSDDEFSRQSFTTKNHVRSGISRRTKASPSARKAESYTKARAEELDSDAAGLTRKPTIFKPETPKKSESEKKNSSKLENYEKPTSVTKHESGSHDSDASPVNKPMSGKTSSTTVQESKVSQKTSVVEEPSSHHPKGETLVSSEITSSDKGESAKKASHVHPKLPDYDTLFQSLRMKRT